MWDIWEFVVSGRLPGTAVEVTFEGWAYIVTVLMAITFLALALRRFSRSRRRLASEQRLGASLAKLELSLLHRYAQLMIGRNTSDSFAD